LAFIIAIHEIADPERFWGGQLDLPAGTTLHSIFPRGDSRKAVCVWESDSPATVSRILDEQVGDASRNELFEIDTQHAGAMGLPAAATASV
jgi:hypothetical protein